jgi:hypothetical protein
MIMGKTCCGNTWRLILIEGDKNWNLFYYLKSSQVEWGCNPQQRSNKKMQPIQKTVG